jgi:hypothetical protein
MIKASLQFLNFAIVVFRWHLGPLKAVLRRCIPVLQFFNKSLAIFNAKAAFDAAPLPLHSDRRFICPEWLQRQSVPKSIINDINN